MAKLSEKQKNVLDKYVSQEYINKLTMSQVITIIKMIIDIGYNKLPDIKGEPNKTKLENYIDKRIFSETALMYYLKDR